MNDGRFDENERWTCLLQKSLAEALDKKIREILVQKPELGVRIEASYDKQNLSTSEDIYSNPLK